MHQIVENFGFHRANLNKTVKILSLTILSSMKHDRIGCIVYFLYFITRKLLKDITGPGCYTTFVTKLMDVEHDDGC